MCKMSCIIAVMIVAVMSNLEISAEILYTTDFSTDPIAAGWTGFAANQWEWGVATASSACSGSQDPAVDNSPGADNYIVGYDIGGCYTNSIPETNLTSPAFDCSAYPFVFVDFYRWLGVESATYDHASVRVSTNGSTWTTVWDHTGESYSDLSWTHINYDISAIASGQSAVQVRFVMGMSDTSVVYCGWNIDDFSLIGGTSGTLDGIVTDDMKAPIEGAIVRVVGTGDSAVTIADGTYTMPVLSGTYEVTCSATGHNEDSATGVVIVGGSTTTQDFTLTYPIIDVSPEFFNVEVNLGEIATNTLAISNMGNGPLDFSLQFRADPTDRDRGPQAFCINLLAKRFHEIPDIDSPETWNTIGSALAGSFYAGDFINNDFTTLYVVDQDTLKLKSIATATGVVTNIGNCAPASGHTWTGMAGAADGTMYMCSTDGAVSKLYTVDFATGALTQIGNVTNSPLLIEIAINAEGDMYGYDIGSDSLIGIDTSTGAGTVIGALGFDASYAQGMDFDFATGILYLAAYNVSTGGDSELRTVNLTTGATTLIGAFPADTEVDCFSITSPSSTWVAFDVTEGTIQAGGNMLVNVTFDSSEIEAPGTYTGIISVNNNSGDASPVDVPVTMIVTDPSAPTSTPTTPPTSTPTADPTTTPTDPTATPTHANCSDLTLNPDEVTFNPRQASPGNLVEISAVIRNTGDVVVDFTEVYFAYELTPLNPDDDPNAELISSPVILTNLDVGDSVTAVTQWDTAGLNATSYPIYIMIHNTIPAQCNPDRYIQTDYLVPVVLNAFTASGFNGSVGLNWMTESELNNIGFDVYRSTTYFDSYIKINEVRIPGAGTSFSRHDYTFTDHCVSNGTPYFYQLVMIDGNAQQTASDIVACVPHRSNQRLRIATDSNRCSFEPGQSLLLYSDVENPGESADVEVQMLLLIDGRLIDSILAPTTVTIGGGTQIESMFLRHLFSAGDPVGNYLVATLVTDVSRSELINVDLTEFSFK